MTSSTAMDELSARRVALAHAIETADAGQALLTTAEVDQADSRARQEALHRAGEGKPLAAREFLALRARHVLGAVGVHHPQLAALQEPAAWRVWLAWAIPLVALVMGVATDAIGNPHRVDLVSLPLLGIVAWNLAMYALLLLAMFWPRRARRSLFAGFSGWGLGSSAGPQAQAVARFHADWLRATGGLHAARLRRVLHLSAAAWALGVILSLVVRGLVVEYRVGWESTFLGPAQVHAILSVLRWPALLVFPFDTFTVVDIAELRFSDGGGAAAGAPWVWMYVALLVTIVIVPRLVLATFAAWREERLARAVPLELQAEYVERIEALMSAAAVQLGLLSHRAGDRDRFLMLLPDRATLPVLVSTTAGDVLRLVDLPLEASPPAPEIAPATWWSRWWPFTNDAALPSRTECDAVIHLVGDREDVQGAAAVLESLARPVVAIDLAGAAGGLSIADLSRPHTGDRLLLDAIAAALPAERRRGFGPLARAWEALADERLHRSMTIVAQHVLYAARQAEEVQAGQLSVRNLMPAEREAQANARETAMARIASRVHESAQSAAMQLRRLLGVSEEAAEDLEHRLEERFKVQQPVDVQQAGLAGAASGAAMGASIDLLAGGLTLGAAAALGAVLGGGAASIAAAWRNRSSPTGATLVQLSDEMLDALVEAGLLRYLAIAHWARGARTFDESWRTDVVARVQAQRVLLAGFWNAARSQPGAEEKLQQSLAQELDAMARAVLKHISR